MIAHENLYFFLGISIISQPDLWFLQGTTAHWAAEHKAAERRRRWSKFEASPVELPHVVESWNWNI